MNPELVVFYLLFMNVLGFYLMGADKRRAKEKKYRISERTLWAIAFLGGASGMTVGMNSFRHKTKHAQFKYGLPFVVLLHIAVFIYFR